MLPATGAGAGATGSAAAGAALDEMKSKELPDTADCGLAIGSAYMLLGMSGAALAAEVS